MTCPEPWPRPPEPGHDPDLPTTSPEPLPGALLTCGDDTYGQLGWTAPEVPAAAPPQQHPGGSSDPLGASPPGAATGPKGPKGSKGPKGPKGQKEPQYEGGEHPGGLFGGDEGAAVPAPAPSSFPDTPRDAPTAPAAAPDAAPDAPGAAPGAPGVPSASALPDSRGTPRRAALPEALLVRAVACGAYHTVVLGTNSVHMAI